MIWMVKMIYSNQLRWSFQFYQEVRIIKHICYVNCWLFTTLMWTKLMKASKTRFKCIFLRYWINCFVTKEKLGRSCNRKKLRLLFRSMSPRQNLMALKIKYQICEIFYPNIVLVTLLLIFFFFLHVNYLLYMFL